MGALPFPGAGRPLDRTLSIAALSVLLALSVPASSALSNVSVNPILNPDFDTYVTAGAPPLVRPVLDRCVGVGHQAYDVLYSSYADWAILTANDVSADPTTAPELATPETVETATGWPAAHAEAIADEPSYAYHCDPRYADTTQLNPWDKSHDQGAGWSNDPGTKFYDVDGDGDQEAVIPRVPTSHTHNLWQSIATPTQAWSANFESFEFTVESGVIPPGANNQIGLGLSPGYMQHPWLGAFWEGAILFRANDMTPDEDGRVRMDPVLQGELICPAGYTPCLEFKAEYNAANAAGKRTLLGQARIVQTSFWSFSGGAGPVVIDDVAFGGIRTAVETLPNPNPGA